MRFRRANRDDPEPRTPRAQDTALFHGARIEIERLTRENKRLKAIAQEHVQAIRERDDEIRHLRVALLHRIGVER